MQEGSWRSGSCRKWRYCISRWNPPIPNRSRPTSSITPFPLDPGYVEDFSEPQLRAPYDYFVEAYVPCLESIRRPYPNSPPSKDVFVTRFLSRGDDFMAWWPPDVITGNDARAGAACPELPPPEVFFVNEPSDSK